MNSKLMRAAVALAVGLSFSASGAPYEDQKIQIQRVQEAKRLGAAKQEQMQLMHEMNQQMEQARAVDSMKPEQMRDWIARHTRLMEQMHQGMAGGEPPMTGPPGSAPGTAR